MVRCAGRGDLAIASFSVAEIECGIAMTPRSNTTLRAQLAAWLEAILATQRILPLDAAAARILGRLHAVPALRNLATTPPHARHRASAETLSSRPSLRRTTPPSRPVTATIFQLIARHCPGLSGVDPWTGQTF